MDAKTYGKKSWKRKAKGQSLVEFALLVPLMIGLFKVLVGVETAISTAIGNQKYARAQLHFLAFNHRYYPENKFLTLRDGRVKQRFWMGVTEPNLYGLGDRVPAISVQVPVTAGANPPRDSEDGGAEEYPTVSNRQNVHVRVSVFTCVPPIAVASSGTQLSGFLTEESLREDTFAGGYQYCAD